MLTSASQLGQSPRNSDHGTRGFEAIDEALAHVQSRINGCTTKLVSMGNFIYGSPPTTGSTAALPPNNPTIIARLQEIDTALLHLENSIQLLELGPN